MNSPVPSLKSYQARRRKLARALAGGVAVLPTAPERTRNADTHYPYRWDSHFHYLTGFHEPEAVLVILGGSAPRSVLFCRARDPLGELWEGVRVGPRAAVSRYGVDEAWPIDQLDRRLPALLANRPSLHTPIGADADWDARVTGWLNAVRRQVRSGVTAPDTLCDVRQAVNEMRLVKDAGELALMKQAAAISVSAHRRAMLATAPGRHEFEVEAELLHEFRRHGAEAPAYPSIVAGGANACILHYVENRAPLRAGDLLLIDAGCEWQGYAADITRTFPVSGRFSGPQRDLYQLVLAAQQAALARIRPRAPFAAYHEAAVRVLVRGLIDLKLCRGSVDGVIESGDYRRFYMHRTGHWLGRDVHDVGDYSVNGRSRPLVPGMVLTVEPGLYVRPAPKVPKAFHHIGIRIEDDVVVTPSGHRVLTDGAPKTVDEIEAWMASS
ncbi:MAG: Xaa-Pro aminopeptidase [Betaproteobacteria bacterium]|nr:Xaa-Pro aminopeptidase [Betaproteobacteria bacterium]